MNKFLSGFLAENGFVFDNTTFNGELKGFQVSGVVNGSNIRAAVNVHLNEGETAQIGNWLQDNKRAFSFIRYYVDENGFYGEINAFSAAKKCVQFLESAISYISSFKQPYRCPFCGDEMTEDKRLVGIGNNKMYAHEKCFDDYCEQVRGNEMQIAAAPNNYLKGALGALAGCIVGGGLFIFLYCVLNLIAGIAGIAGSLLAAFLWDKLGAKNDKVKIIVIWVMTIIIFTVAVFAGFLIDIAVEFPGENALDIFLTLISSNASVAKEYQGAVIYDGVMSAIFILVGNIYTTIRVLQTQKLMSNSFAKY